MAAPTARSTAAAPAVQADAEDSRLLSEASVGMVLLSVSDSALADEAVEVEAVLFSAEAWEAANEVRISAAEEAGREVESALALSVCGRAAASGSEVSLPEISEVCQGASYAAGESGVSWVSI